MNGPGAAALEEVGPAIRRLLAPNPSPFTFSGTQTYVVGRGGLAVIDPGPDDSRHIDALLAVLVGERVDAIIVTHTHRDHSPGSRLLAGATGAPIVGCAPLALSDHGPRADAEFDPDYAPDRILADGEQVRGDGWTLEAVATPGHTSNHLCFALPEAGALFTGDHVMGWSTTIVSPPDGDMAAYIASLERLMARDDRIFYPTHGPAIDNPKAHLQALLEHRRVRERRILDQVERGAGSIRAIVASTYTDTPPSLHPAAERSVLAHLIDLERRGRVRRDGETWMAA